MRHAVPCAGSPQPGGLPLVVIGRRDILSALLYLLATGALCLYTLFAGNEYAWMSAPDNGAALPEDPEQAFKALLFGIPALLLSATVPIHAFFHQGRAARGMALVFFGAAIGVLLV